MPSVSVLPVCMAETLDIEVLLAWPDRVDRCRLSLPAGSTVAEAAEASGLLARVPGAGLAVFGKEVSPGQQLEAGDRVEILRPLLEDPKTRRRRRAGR